MIEGLLIHSHSELEKLKIKAAGLLLFIGGVQSFLSVTISEALYPTYSTSQNFISDLGIGPSALIFRSSTLLFGIIAFLSIYLIYQVLKPRLFIACLAFANIGMIGGIFFTEDFPIIHSIFSLIFIAFAGAAAIASFKIVRTPLSYVSIILGVVSLSALILLVSGVFLGLGKGGMERMCLYPILLWLIGFGGYLIGEGERL